MLKEELKFVRSLLTYTFTISFAQYVIDYIVLLLHINSVIQLFFHFMQAVDALNLL